MIKESHNKIEKHEKESLFNYINIFIVFYSI